MRRTPRNIEPNAFQPDGFLIRRSLVRVQPGAFEIYRGFSHFWPKTTSHQKNPSGTSENRGAVSKRLAGIGGGL